MVGFEECLLGIFLFDPDRWEEETHAGSSNQSFLSFQMLAVMVTTGEIQTANAMGNNFSWFFWFLLHVRRHQFVNTNVNHQVFFSRPAPKMGRRKKSSPDLRWNDHVKFVYPKQARGGHKCKMKHFHIDSLHVQFIQNKIKNFALGFPNGEHQCNRYPSRGLQRQKNCHQT